MPPLPQAITPFSPERLRQRRAEGAPAQLAAPITIHEYDPSWPAQYAAHEARIRHVLGEVAFVVEHVGSTAVPGMPAKNRIDIDLIVADPTDEDSYVPSLEAAGYVLRARDPDWYQHRCLWTADHDANLHVFGPDCDEHLRHLLFRDWLRTHPDDRARYAAVKRRLAADNQSLEISAMANYISGKSEIVIEILRRAGLS